MQQTILIVEDDSQVRKVLRNVLTDAGFVVLGAATVKEALAAVQDQSIDLITLDIHLGSDDGLTLARAIRTHSDVPIIMITGKDDVIDRVVGLEVGADDYITKPFHIREVVARVRSVLRRAGGARETRTSPEGGFDFDGMLAFPERLELLDRNGENCALTSGDFKLLAAFLARPKRVLSRDQLMDLVGGVAWTPMDRTIDNQIARLRKKIEVDPADPKLIKTVRGVGYTFACDVRAT